MFETLNQILIHRTSVFVFNDKGEKQSIEWAMRLRIGLYIAEALQYCNDEGSPLYDDLNADRILFDEVGTQFIHLFCKLIIDMLFFIRM